MNNSKHEQELLERLSALYDGENVKQLDNDSSCVEEQQEHLQKWSLIGAVMRDEYNSSIDNDFVANVAKRIEETTIEQVIDNDEPGFRIVPYIKKAAVYVSQLAVAAAVAAVTVVGYQTYNAADEAQLISPAASNIVPVSGVNLASFDHNHDTTIQLNEMRSDYGYDNNANNELEIRKQQNQELQRINAYLEGYLFDSASN